MSKFWRFLDLSLINCEIELDLSWLEDCIISQISRTPVVAANPNVNPPFQAATATKTSNATFQVNSTKLYVPINDNIKPLENIRQGFK